MKKKLVALLLCLVMALSLIPTTAWAALDTGHSIPVTFTVLYVDDKYYTGYSFGSSENTTFVCQYSTSHSDTAYSNHAIAISDIKAAAGRATVNEGYQIVGWAKEAKRNPTIWGLDVPGTTACNKDTPIYLVAKNPNPAPVEPSAPSTTDVENLNGLVNVYCTTENVLKDSGKLITGTYDIGSVTGSANSGYTCTITIKEANVDDYMSRAGEGHVTDSEATQDREITLYYNATSEEWEMGNDLANLYAKCNPAPNAPEKPTEEEVQALYGPVRIDCATDNTHDAVSALKPQSYTIGDVAGDATSGYTCTITINDTSKYIPADHEQDPEKENDLTITLEYDKENSNWIATDTATIYVKCTPAQEAPAAPTAEDLKSIRGVLVDCLSDPQAITHSDMAFPFFENTYEVGDVVLDQETDQYTCVVTVTDPQAYVNSYDFMLGLMLGKTDLIHHVMQPTTQTPTVTLVYDETNGWQRPERTYATITAICMIKAPTAKDLEGYKLVKVDCDTKISHGKKTYALLDGTFTTKVTGDGDGNFQCVITITQDGAKKYVEQYSKDLGKTHSLKKLEDATITLKYKDNSWVVDNNDNSASILANCVPTGSHSNTNPSKPSNGKPVTSQKTFDAGIALYAGLSILSLTGGALVIRKRKEF